MASLAGAGVVFICAAWVAWAVLWVLMSLRTKSVLRRESRTSRLLHLTPLAIAAILLLSPHAAGPWLNRQILPRDAHTVFIGVGLVTLGLAFAVWARLVLAGNWSGTVTLKAAHELVQTGPYALARHPIYTGLITALLGTTIIIDAGRAVLAFVIVTVSFLWKMRTEEAFMRAAFGAEYDAYCARTRALVPFVW